VADFGIARAGAGAGTEKLTDPGLVVGTPAYMSPSKRRRCTPTSYLPRVRRAKPLLSDRGNGELLPGCPFFPVPENDDVELVAELIALSVHHGAHHALEEKVEGIRSVARGEDIIVPDGELPGADRERRVRTLISTGVIPHQEGGVGCVEDSVQCAVGEQYQLLEPWARGRREKFPCRARLGEFRRAEAQQQRNILFRVTVNENDPTSTGAENLSARLVGVRCAE
jgi:hypothetical protein